MWDRKYICFLPSFAKKLAKQHKLDINEVVGTGPFRRITPADVEAAAGIIPAKSSVSTVSAPLATATASLAKSAQAKSAPTFAEIPGATIVPFTTMQAAVSKNMIESLYVPTFRVGFPIITDALDAFYAKVKSKGVTMTALLAKVVAMALVQQPVVNASCKYGKNFTYNGSINIAVAVAIHGGLITPVFQDADKINVTADHRIVYGADLAGFLKTFAHIVQDPDRLTM